MRLLVPDLDGDNRSLELTTANEDEGVPKEVLIGVHDHNDNGYEGSAILWDDLLRVVAAYGVAHGLEEAN